MILEKAQIFFKALLIFLALLLLILFVHGFWALLGLAITQSMISAEQLLLERLYPITVAGILIFWTRKKKPDLFVKIKSALYFNKETAIIFIKYTLLSLIILYLCFIISGIFDHYEFIHYGLVDYSRSTILKQTLLVGLIGNIFVAIGEEIIFRGFLLNYTSDLSKSNVFALIFTSFVFCLHPYTDLSNYIIAFLGGLTMGYAYLKFKTLYIPIGIHLAYNVFNFTIASEPGHGPQLPYLLKFDYSIIADGLGAWVELFIILSFLLILCFLWLKKVPHKKETRGELA